MWHTYECSTHMLNNVCMCVRIYIANTLLCVCQEALKNFVFFPLILSKNIYYICSRVHARMWQGAQNVAFDGDNGKRGRAKKTWNKERKILLNYLSLCNKESEREFCLFCVRFCFIFQMILVFLFSSNFQTQKFPMPVYSVERRTFKRP